MLNVLRVTHCSCILQIVSQAEASGQVAVQELAAIQGQTFDTPQILISNNMGGMEDIPVCTFLLLLLMLAAEDVSILLPFVSGCVE